MDTRLKLLQIADSVFDELWPEQSARVVPQIAVRRKDAYDTSVSPGLRVDIGRRTVSKKVIPLLLELGTLAKVLELGRKDRFDVLFIGSKDDPLAHCDRFDGIWILRLSIL